MESTLSKGQMSSRKYLERLLTKNNQSVDKSSIDKILNSPKLEARDL